MNTTRRLGLLLTGALGSCAMVGGEEGYFPHRGTFGFDASSVEPGTTEMGIGLDGSPPEDRVGAPINIMVGLTPTTEFIACLEPYTIEAAPGEDIEGLGETVIGLHHVLQDQESVSAAALVALKLPTGDESAGLGSGEVDAITAGMLTWGFGDAALTAYYETGWVRSPDGGIDLEHSLGFIGEKPFGDSWGGFAELVLTAIPVEDFEASQVGTGLAFGLTPYLGWDLGLRTGLDDGPELEVFFGLSWAMPTGALAIQRD